MNHQSAHLATLVLLALIVQICSHGYMSDPPNRSSAWRYGFQTKPNFNDNAVTCGRVLVSECGVCGDRLNQTLGGKYGSGVIVKAYKAGQVIRIKTKITANHAGWFEWSICKIKNNQPATEDCFIPLKVLKRNPPNVERPETKWLFPMADGLGEFDTDVQLPQGFTCDHCVLRWLWNCGDDFGCDKNGNCGLGFGPRQAKFYSCADISVTGDGRRPITTTTTPRVVTTTRFVTTGPCGRRSFTQNIDDQGRIVGGIRAVLGAYPYQVSIRKKRLLGGPQHPCSDALHICGGTIIDETTIITAAHCRADPWFHCIVAGDHNRTKSGELTEQMRDYSRYIPHPSFNATTFENDIAIIKLDHPLVFNEFVQPACLPAVTYPYTAGNDVIVSGWGHLTEGGRWANILRVAVIYLVSDESCREKYIHESIITDDMFCAGLEAGGVDACQGDSGGPLIAGDREATSGFTLLGVVSKAEGCARGEFPGIYARVTHFLKWIERERKREE